MWVALPNPRRQASRTCGVVFRLFRVHQRDKFGLWEACIYRDFIFHPMSNLLHLAFSFRQMQDDTRTKTVVFFSARQESCFLPGIQQSPTVNRFYHKEQTFMPLGGGLPFAYRFMESWPLRVIICSSIEHSCSTASSKQPFRMSSRKGGTSHRRSSLLKPESCATMCRLFQSLKKRFSVMVSLIVELSSSGSNRDLPEANGRHPLGCAFRTASLFYQLSCSCYAELTARCLSARWLVLSAIYLKMDSGSYIDKCTYGIHVSSASGGNSSWPLKWMSGGGT